MNRYRPDLNTEDTTALAALGDGSIGRALELAEEGGVELFQSVVALLEDVPSLSITRVHALADKALRGDVFRTLSGLLSWWLARIAANGARGSLSDLAEIVPGEHAVAGKLLALAPPGAWAETWAEVGHIAERTLAVHMDRKRSLILILNAIERTAKSQQAAITARNGSFPFSGKRLYDARAAPDQRAGRSYEVTSCQTPFTSQHRFIM